MNTKSPPVAVQLYSVREELYRDPESTLRAVADMGYDGVETAGLAHRAPAEFAALLAANGLRLEGSHVSIESVLPAAIEKTVADSLALGCHRVIVPWIDGPWTATVDGLKRFLSVMNAAGDRFAEAGIEFGYHNHEFEFRYGPAGCFPFDLMDAGFTSNVKFQFDMGLVCAARADAIALANAHAGRMMSIHAKPFAKADPAPYLCEDDVDWPAVVAASVRAGSDWVVVEHEHYAAPPMECIRRDLENLRAALA
jgi:sugar phosphate isomerase/epimerase